MSLFGGKRALWIEPAGDEIAEGVEALLEAPASESSVIAIAGSLRKTSALLKLAEAHPAALSHISYVPEGRDLERIVVDLGRQQGLSVAPNLPGGSPRLRPATRSGRHAGTGQVRAVPRRGPRPRDRPGHGRFAGRGLGRGRFDAARRFGAGGADGALLEELGRLPHGGSEAVPVLRALQRRLLMLAPLRARVERGERVDAVMTSMGKTLFWKDKPLMSGCCRFGRRSGWRKPLRALRRSNGRSCCGRWRTKRRWARRWWAGAGGQPLP